jgi:hypothetical protein
MTLGVIAADLVLGQKDANWDMKEELIKDFLTDGFIKLPGAVPTDVVEACASLLWEEIGLNPKDPTGWTEPFVLIGGMEQPPFVQAVNSLVLLDAYESLAGPGRWMPRASMGSFPLRFPHDREPDGLGWHIEGSYLPEGADVWWVNVRSRDRALLTLFLFTDVDESDGPTRIRVGSHLDVPRVLAPYGETGVSLWPALARSLPPQPIGQLPTQQGRQETFSSTIPFWFTLPRRTMGHVPDS